MSRHSLVRADERKLVDYLVEYAYAYRREAVANYYITLKSKRFVILAGPPDVEKMNLAQSVAEALVGKSTLQWSCLQAHPWWSTDTRHPGYFAIAHARFNALKMTDLIDLALEYKDQGRPFFLGVKHMSRAEVACYFHDLPRGLLWRPDVSAARVRLPDNLFVTGTLDTGEGNDLASSQDVFPYSTVVCIGRDDLASPEQRRRIDWQEGDWEQWFVRARVQRADQARVKLARILPGNQPPLAPLYELARRFEDVDLSPYVIEEAWLYLANAFDEEGRGLLADSVAENLAIAYDYVLVQHVLPRIVAQRDARPAAWDGIRAHLALHHPRAYAWTQRFVRSRQAAPQVYASGVASRLV